MGAGPRAAARGWGRTTRCGVACAGRIRNKQLVDRECAWNVWKRMCAHLVSPVGVWQARQSLLGRWGGGCGRGVGVERGDYCKAMAQALSGTNALHPQLHWNNQMICGLSFS